MIPALLLIASALTAPPTSIVVYGGGNDSCGRFLHATADGRDDYKQWLGGFLAAAQISAGHQFSADIDGELGWIEKYCAENPLSNFLTAADALRRTLIIGNSP